MQGNGRLPRDFRNSVSYAEELYGSEKWCNYFGLGRENKTSWNKQLMRLVRIEKKEKYCRGDIGNSESESLLTTTSYGTISL